MASMIAIAYFFVALITIYLIGKYDQNPAPKEGSTEAGLTGCMDGFCGILWPAFWLLTLVIFVSSLGRRKK